MTLLNSVIAERCGYLVHSHLASWDLPIDSSISAVVSLLPVRNAAPGCGPHRLPRRSPFLLAGAGGFYSGIERQNISLKGYFIDDFHDLGDLAACELIHG